MVMLIRLLGPEFVVWDEAASIRFLRPGRSTLHATFRLDRETVAGIAADASAASPIRREFKVELVDGAGQVCFDCIKTIYVRYRGEPGRLGSSGHLSGIRRGGLRRRNRGG